jgi:hypothetical protein
LDPGYVCRRSSDVPLDHFGVSLMTKYYGVIGNRDYIKLRGEKRPYWEFLDVQPDGWLSSLVYKRKDVPHDKPMIWDCGAWSYKNDDAPKYTPQSALDLYREYAHIGSMIVAPDHILIDGVDHAARRTINRSYAAKFLNICPTDYIPLAVIHGQTIDERVEHAQELLRLGYTHLSVGGVAARASQKREVMAIVAALREITRGSWLHVLGLSSPPYMREWRRLGVDSCDGSSHFKQAFTGGAFFTNEQWLLIKHKAVRPGEEVPYDMPLCDCAACKPLREDGIDTRTYGSNENNMGRAAHNQNALMRAQREAMRQTVVLVACCGPKLSNAAPASDIYQSALFKKARAYAETYGDKWYVLSAKYGLLRSDEIVDPYDLTLSTMTTAQRREWDGRVIHQLLQAGVRGSDKIVSLCGNDYSGWIEFTDLSVDRPMRGLGIGQQLAWLDANTQPTETQSTLF